MNFNDIDIVSNEFNEFSILMSLISDDLKKQFGTNNVSYYIDNTQVAFFEIFINTQRLPEYIFENDTLIVSVDKKTNNVSMQYKQIGYHFMEVPYIYMALQVSYAFSKNGFHNVFRSNTFVCDILKSADYELIKFMPGFTFICLDNCRYYTAINDKEIKNVMILRDPRCSYRDGDIIQDIGNAEIILKTIYGAANYTSKIYFNEETIKPYRLYKIKKFH